MNDFEQLWNSGLRPHHLHDGPQANLSPREKEVLALIGQGYSLGKIATHLNRSYATVKSHRYNLGRKLGISNLSELTRLAIERNLAPVDRHPTNESGKAWLSVQDGAGHAEKVLRRIESGIDHLTGSVFFDSLVEHLAEEFKVRCAMISRLASAPLTRIRTLSVWIDGSLAPGFEFDYRGTPCEQVIHNREYFCQAGICSLFKFLPPEIAVIGPESYLGTALIRHSIRRPLGLLTVLHDQPMRFGFEPMAIMRILAAKITIEICNSSEMPIGTVELDDV